MRAAADVRAYLMQKSAFAVRYGDRLRFAGEDHPGPTEVRVPTRHGEVRCEVYHRVAPGPPPPVYVHLHGGAFVMRRPQMDDFFARVVVAEVGATVVNVDYDVAPQVRYPVAQHQAHDVAAWVANNAGLLGADADRVAVGGFSAGGNLAASACLQARDTGSFQPLAQLLGVPSLDVAAEVGHSGATGSAVTPSLQRLVRATYFPDREARREPYASPLRATELFGLPPTMVVTAERDALRAEGDEFARALRQARVDVEHLVVPGRDHYFLDGRADPDQARAVLARITSFLAQRLGTPAG